jgi:Lar family restriction alleviation protein
MTPPLKPCPFCEGQPEVIREGSRQPEWAVFCKGCDAKTSWRCANDGGEAEAIAAWNRRSPASQPEERVEAAMKALAEGEQIDEDGVMIGREPRSFARCSRRSEQEGRVMGKKIEKPVEMPRFGTAYSAAEMKLLLVAYRAMRAIGPRGQRYVNSRIESEGGKPPKIGRIFRKLKQSRLRAIRAQRKGA